MWGIDRFNAIYVWIHEGIAIIKHRDKRGIGITVIDDGGHSK